MFLGLKKQISQVEAKFNFDARRRSARILVIDDDQNSFDPFKPLQKEGYAIDFWQKIEDLTKLEQGYYDIIVLDIRGVGQEWSSEEEGFAILELVKSRNPSQVVIAYSGETFDFSKQKFYRMADDMIPKSSVDAAKCKAVIDGLIMAKLRPTALWKLIEDLLLKNGLSKRQVKKLESKIVTALENNQDEQTLQRMIKRLVSDKDVWITLGILIAKLWMATAG